MGDDLSPPPPARAILLVEDDEAVRTSLQFALELEGFTVDAFRTSAAALAHRPSSCAALIVDYWLPDINGLALLARLRAAGVDAPALLITSNPTTLLRTRAKAVGAIVIEKPLLGDAIIAAVQDLTSAPWR